MPETKMERIKVMHVITRLERGGSTENTILTLQGLDQQRYLPEAIVGYCPPEAAVEIGKGIKVFKVPQMRHKITPFLDLLALIRIYLILRREKPHIVHTHTSKAGILGRWAAKLAGVPIIVHTPHGHVFYGYFSPLSTRFFIFLERITGRITDRIITLTEKGKEEHTLYRIAPAEKFVPIYSGIERNFQEKIKVITGNLPRQQRLKEELGFLPGTKVIGSIGRLEPVKGYTYFLKAARLILTVIARSGNLAFLIVGEGKLRRELENEALAFGINDRVKFLGWRDDTMEILSIIDIFVLPSLNEGMGRVLLEAMLMGKPVVAGNVGGIPELVEDGRTGFLVSARDYNGLADKITILLQNPAIAERIGLEGKRRAEKEEFSAEGMVRRIDELYRELLQMR